MFTSAPLSHGGDLLFKACFRVCDLWTVKISEVYEQIKRYSYSNYAILMRLQDMTGIPR